MGETVEARLRQRIQQLPPGTADQIAAVIDLASCLHDQGKVEEATQLYQMGLLGGSDLSQSGTQPLSTADQRPSSSLTPDSGRHLSYSSGTAEDDDDWENGGWETKLQGLSLRDGKSTSTASRDSQDEPCRGAAPLTRRADRPLFCPSKQHSPDLSANGGKNGTASPGLHPPPYPPTSARATATPPGLLQPTKADVIPLEGRHLLEVVGIKTTDTEHEVEAYLRRVGDFVIPPLIRWADASHAVAVFQDTVSAQMALANAPGTGRLWLKPFAQASPQCKQIAASELQPPRLRPKTTDVVARRLLSNALQDSSLRDLAGEKTLQAQRRERISEKARRRQLLDAAWDD